jgi:hypothetical protein
VLTYLGYLLYKVVKVKRAASGHTIVIVRYKGLNDRRWDCVSKTTKSLIQLIGVDSSATVPIVPVENALVVT